MFINPIQERAMYIWWYFFRLSSEIININTANTKDQISDRRYMEFLNPSNLMSSNITNALISKEKNRKIFRYGHIRGHLKSKYSFSSF